MNLPCALSKRKEAQWITSVTAKTTETKARWKVKREKKTEMAENGEGEREQVVDIGIVARW